MSPADVASPLGASLPVWTRDALAAPSQRFSQPRAFADPQRELRAQAVEKRSQPKKPKAPLSNQEFRNPHNDPNALQVSTYNVCKTESASRNVHEGRDQSLWDQGLLVSFSTMYYDSPRGGAFCGADAAEQSSFRLAFIAAAREILRVLHCLAAQQRTSKRGVFRLRRRAEEYLSTAESARRARVYLGLFG